MAAANLLAPAILLFFAVYVHSGLLNHHNLQDNDVNTIFAFNSSVRCNLVAIYYPNYKSVLHIGIHRPSKWRVRFSKSRIVYYSNTNAFFNYQYLHLCGDISSNPGPITQKTSKSCSVCTRTVASNHRTLTCDTCFLKTHIKCGGVTPKEYKQFQSSNNYSWTCPPCLEQLKQLPFAEVSNIDSSHSSIDPNEEQDTWSDFDKIANKHRTNVKIGHINANSIAGFKFHEIKSWLLSGRLDILIISETKLDATFPSSQFHIDGFRMCRKDRNIHGGGLMAYVRSDMCFSVLRQFKNLTVADLSTFRTEFITLKVKIAKSWLTIVGIYRPPNIPKYQWKLELSALFEASTTVTNDVIFLGDFNCDLMQPDKPPMDGRELCDLLDIYSLKNLIKSPTRVGKTSETLLDLVLTTNKDRMLTSGVVDVQISDHSLVYTILRISAPRLRSRKICMRSLKHFNHDLFVQDLYNIPFHIMDIFDEVDDKLFVFESLYTDIVNVHAPLKQVHVRGNQVPFMTETWRKAIRHRNMLWKRFSRERTDINYANYKIQRNKCTSLRRNAIKDYFRKKTEATESNPREFWDTYRPFLHSKKSKQANDIILKENDVIITDKKQIANAFNEHFIHITDGLVEISEQDFGTDCSAHPSIKSIYEQNVDQNMSSVNFRCTNQAEVEKILLNINSRKSPGHDFIQPKLVKESASAIARPLTMIMNDAIIQCRYPCRWKMGQITPLFKKDNELDKSNYRPVTVLPVLNNVFERLLASQLEEFYKDILSDFISAYRRKFSCETALLKLTEDWRQSRDNREIVAIVSMDLSKAFDTISHTLLLSKLKAYMVSVTVVVPF